MIACYLGIGSNLSCPTRQIHHCIQSIQKLPRTHLVKISNIYQTPPIGMRYQPTYANIVLLIHTQLPPMRLLKLCQLIERKQKRVKKYHWGPRTIDIDILLYGNLKLNTPRLVIPHPEINHRDFVLLPLTEICHNFKYDSINLSA